MLPMRTGPPVPAEAQPKKATSKPRPVGYVVSAAPSHQSNRETLANQTAKIPTHYLNGTTTAVYPKGMISGANTIQAPSSLSMNATATAVIEKNG